MNRLKTLTVALPLFALTAAAPAHAQPPLAASGPYALTQFQENDDLAIWQMVAGHPLAPADKQAIQKRDIILFRRDPAWLLANLRQAHKAMPRLQSQNAVERAHLRKVNLVDIYCTPKVLHMTEGEAARMQAVISRYVPVVYVSKAAGIVVTEQDITAWQAAAALIARKSHTPMIFSRPQLVQWAKTSAFGPVAEQRIGSMERNWAAYQLGWKNEPASDQRRVMSRLTGLVHQNPKQAALFAAGTAVTLAAYSFGDYPYALSPKFASAKAGLLRRNAAFANAMMTLGWVNSATSHAIAGQGFPSPFDP